MVSLVRFFAVILTLCPVALASAENNGRGSKAIALGNAFVAIADNAWAVAYNPAGLAQLSSTQGAVFFVPQQFQLPELRTVALAGAVPFNFGTLGLSVDQFGFALYRETNVTIAAGRTIDWGVSAGVALNFHRISIERYGAAQRLTVDLGLLARPHDDLNFGFAIKNVTATTIGETRERLPQILMIGTRYAPWNEFQLTIECEKDTRHPLIVKAGVEQRFFEILALRLGISTNPDKFSAGIGARYSMFEFSYAGYSHPQLGWTHQVEISFQLGE
jgi:long-subunit fatty acid transport protein